MNLQLDATFAHELEGLFVPWQAAEFPEPALLVLNEDLARELGLDPAALRTPAGIGLLIGAAVPEGALPIAQGYAGHQFGGYSPRLGDGRALLLGELTDLTGNRQDLHLKGSGGTPFSRGGDGKAAVGPMLREYVIGEAMHALGVPTTRGLAVLGTGEHVHREEGALPGAVLVRVAASHLRVGSFQYASALTATKQDSTLLRRLADYAIARHHPSAAETAQPYLALLQAVTARQAELVARWMCLGFVHGVLNTDNVTISGETIDYGPCAFMEGYDPATVFSSIDHGGRYAYGNQPPITLWNLSRFAEALLPLIDDDTEAAVTAATAVLDHFPERYTAHWLTGMFAKLGLDVADGASAVPEGSPEDKQLVLDLLPLLQADRVDWTSFWRALSDVARGDSGAARDLFLAREDFDAWAQRWLARLPDPAAAATTMDTINPAYIARNHLVEEALDAATKGDLGPVEALVEVIRRPFEQRPGLEPYTEPAPQGSGPYQTFCGT